MSRSIAKPGLVITAAAVLFAASLVLFSRLGQELTPTLDEKNIVMEVKRVPSTALAQAQAMQLEIGRSGPSGNRSFRKSFHCRA